VLFAGGGTGGHLYPALAVAQHLRATDPDFECVFMGSAQGLEARLVPQNGFTLHTIPGSGFRRMGLAGRLRSLWSFVRGVSAALVFERRFRPDVVLATGGYASLAAGIAAAVLRVPLIVQEQNSIPGHTNRLLGRLACEVHVAFPGSERFFKGRATVHLTGNPVRPDLLRPTAPLTGVPAGLPCVLVVGGSRGARSINTAVSDAIPLVAERMRVVWLWQTGELDHERLAPRWGGAPDVILRAYLDDMAAAYATAAILVCRSGAMTLAEITSLGKAAILVPFPGAVDDHQTANARTLVDTGAAVLLPDHELSGPRLADEVCALLGRPLDSMRENSLAQARPRATQQLAAALRRQAAASRLEMVLCSDE
jgi:UDP-N-acetylglucosamine--N-acetylmuramyl-(pentapeptide) pyrophosphoryl-undecaprenol N-acetylglucosamine transferase